MVHLARVRALRLASGDAGLRKHRRMRRMRVEAGPNQRIVRSLTLKRCAFVLLHASGGNDEDR